MRKISLTSKRLFLLAFIVLSLLVMVPTECYAKTSTVLGSTYKVKSDLERQAVAQIAQYIYDCSVASGYTSYNWAGCETTENHIYDAAEGVGDTYSISFFVGHGGTGYEFNGAYPIPERQYWIYDSDGNRVYDREIYPHSHCKNVRLVFLWACKQGDIHFTDAVQVARLELGTELQDKLAETVETQGYEAFKSEVVRLQAGKGKRGIWPGVWQVDRVLWDRRNRKEMEHVRVVDKAAEKKGFVDSKSGQVKRPEYIKGFIIRHIDDIAKEAA